MAKVRMQILLEKDQKKMLEKEANARNTSIGHLIREAVELYRSKRPVIEAVFSKEDPLWNIVGAVDGTDVDLSEEHDHYIYGVGKRNRRGKRK